MRAEVTGWIVGALHLFNHVTHSTLCTCCPVRMSQSIFSRLDTKPLVCKLKLPLDGRQHNWENETDPLDYGCIPPLHSFYLGDTNQDEEDRCSRDLVVLHVLDVFPECIPLRQEACKCPPAQQMVSTLQVHSASHPQPCWTAPCMVHSVGLVRRGPFSNYEMSLVLYSCST